jgi:hypothetical protein
MLSWCKTRRAAVLFGTGGVLLVALLVHRIVPAAGQAVKKGPKLLSIPHPVKPEAAPPTSAVPPPLPAYAPAPTAGTAPLPPSAFPPVPPPTDFTTKLDAARAAALQYAAVAPPATDFTSKSIDQLLNDLDAVRAKKGELDTQEKKLIAVLRQKLADQEQRLRKHGLVPAEEPTPVPVAPAPPATTGPVSN